MIYLDNAATTYHKPEAVYNAVLNALKNPGNADRGVNEASLSSGRIIFSARMKLAQLFRIHDPSRIAFTSNSTESLNIAIKGLLSEGDHVITTIMEHNSVLRPLYEMEQKGVEITFLGCDEDGNLRMEDLPAAIKKNTKAIICTHGSNLTGNLVDIQQIGTIAKEHDLIFIVDASQTAGVQDIDVEQMNIGILCFTGHKSLMGPQGTGGIYVREDIILKPFKTGGSGVKTFEKEHPSDMPTALEAGTLNYPGIAGLGEGVSFILNISTKEIRKKEQELMMLFYNGIKDIENITIYGDFTSSDRCPIVAFNIDGCDSWEVSDILDQEYHISVRSGGHCAPKMHEHLGTRETGAVRFSFSWFNTEAEVVAAVNAVREISREAVAISQNIGNI